MTATADARLPLGMRPAEYERVGELLDACRPKRTLETGLANGGSAVVVCRWLAANGGESHTAIDPFQSAPPPQGFAGAGVKAVADAGFARLLTTVEDFGHLALPRLVAEGKRFQFVLIDGYHSFDYTLLDLFYADLLLDVGGVVALHDTGMPSVYKACRFLETQKPYERLSPPPAVIRRSLLGRVGRRAGQILGGRSAEANDRRTRWYSLAAYRKTADRITDEWAACEF